MKVRCWLLGVSVLAGGAAAAGAEGGVRFSEIMYSPPPGESGGEWIELCNRTVRPVSLAGWRLAGGVEFLFPDDAWIDPGAYLVVCRDVRAFLARFPDVPNAIGDLSGRLSDTGEMVEIRDADDARIDIVRYRSVPPWPEAARGQGPSIELLALELDGDYGDAWRASRTLLGTPGAPNSRSIQRSSEPLLPAGATWAYFKGTSEPPADWLAPDFDDDAWDRGPASFGYGVGRERTLLDDMLNGYTTLYVRARFQVEDPARFGSFQLDVEYDDGYVVYLNGEEAARRDFGSSGQIMSHDAVAADGPAAPRQGAHRLDPALVRAGWNVLAVQGANEAIDNRDFYLDPVLTAVIGPREEGGAFEVRINEVGRDAEGSWIEFFNAGRAPADLGGLRLGLAVEAAPETVLPAITVPPYGYAVVREADLGATLDAGPFVYLADAAGETLIDGMPAVTGGASTGRFPDGTRDVYPLDVATPGARNDLGIPRDLVITEIMYHPLGNRFEDEYLEILNRGGAAVNLTGWSLAGGVRYEFPAGLALEPGERLVVAASPEAIEATYAITDVLGPFDGRLSNAAETILLLDPEGRPADRVRYADDGDWPPEADGRGPALELIDADAENDAPFAWIAQGATPRAPNSVEDESGPTLRNERQFPAVPAADEPVTIEIDASDDGAVAEVTLFWRAESEGDWSQAAMRDDGEAPDLAAGDGRYAAEIPGYGAARRGTAVLWYAEARDDGDRVTRLPGAGEARPFIYRVEPSDALAPSTPLPLYRIFMTDAGYDQLWSRNIWSEVHLPCSVAAGDRVYRGAGIRFRGKGSRDDIPRSYHIAFTEDRSLPGVRRLLLNAHGPQRQRLGLQTFRAAELPGPRSRWVSLVINGRFTRMYIEVERTDEEMLHRNMPGDDEGNLYRGHNSADLRYLGDDPDDYRVRGSGGGKRGYEKATNDEEDDWTDLIDLCRVLAIPEHDAYIEELWRRVDVDQWARYFAVHTILSNQEGGIYRDTGDDYFAYCPPNGRFILLPWDMDSVFLRPTERIFRPDVRAIRRFLTTPEIAPLYWGHLRELLAHSFSIEAVRRRIADLPPVVSDSFRAEADSYLPARTAFIRDQIHEALTATASQVAGGKADIVPLGATWRFFRGRSEPEPQGDLDWRQPDFDDADWETGPAAIGYGDGDDATTLDDMRNAYSTVYLRRTFVLEDPANLAGQILWVDYDDGFVAYLNGTEIGRANADGDPPPHDAFARGGHGASVDGGDVFTRPLDGFVGVARAGANVLAVLALNVNLNSSDLTSHPAIRFPTPGGARFFSGCGGQIPFAGGAMDLDGFAPVHLTSRVLVDGTQAAYDVLTGAWRLPGLADPAGTIHVRAIGPFGGAVAELVLEVTRVDALPAPPAVIADETHWDPAAEPHAVAGSLGIAPAGRLVVSAGARVELQPDASIRVEGELVIDGTAEGRVRLAGASCDDPWGRIAVASGGRLTIRSAQLEGGGAQGAMIAIEAGGELVLEDTRAAGARGFALRATGGTVTVRRATFDGLAALHATGAQVTIEGCRVLDPRDPGPAILLDGDGVARVEDVDVAGGMGPGIEVAAGRATVVRAYVHDRLGPGVRAAGGSLRCESSILVGLPVGAAAGPGASLEIDHATIAYCDTGLDAASGASVSVRSSILWASGTVRRGAGDVVFAYSDLQAPQPGEGNIAEDPRFADPRAGEFGLSAGSPAIRAGEGETDMGAVPYEIPGVEYRGGDADGDGVLTIGDAIYVLAYLFAHGTPPVCLGAVDNDADGQITLGDAVYLLNYLFAGGPAPRRETVTCPAP